MQRYIRRAQRGFTLMELMIVVAIIAVLAAIAIPQYQTYITRTRVTEGMSLASVAKTNVGDIWQAAVDNVDGYARGYTSPTESRFVNNIAIDAVSGAVTITFQDNLTGGNPAAATLVLVPFTGGGADGNTTPEALPVATAAFAPNQDSIRWRCLAAGANGGIAFVGVNPGTLPADFAPADCRR
jgi:type IV pilus assembly protein PilA